MRTRSTIIGIFVFLLAGCGLPPQIKPSDKAQLEALKGPDVGSIESTLLTQAQEAENTGDYLRAEETYKQLIDKYPTNKDYMLAFANDLRRSGDNESALLLEDKLLKKDPNNPAFLEAKALTLMNRGEFKDAGAMFGEVMKTDPKRWRTLNAIGILFAMKGRNSDAMAYYNSALDASPNNPSVQNNIALTYAMDKDYDKSIETFKHAKIRLPENGSESSAIDMNLALVYAIAGKLDDAERTAAPHLNKAGLYNNMGFYSYLAKNNELAKGYLNMALTQSPTYYERAWKNLNDISGGNGEETTISPSGSVLKKPEAKPVKAEDTKRENPQTADAKPKKKVKPKPKPEDSDDEDSASSKVRQLPMVSVKPNKDLSTRIDDIPPPRTVDLGPFPVTQIQKNDSDEERRIVPSPNND